MGKSTKEFAMPKTHALPALLDLLGIHSDEACLVAAHPLSAVFVVTMTPFGSDSLRKALDVEKILEEVSAKWSGSSQKDEGLPIKVESDEEMEPTEYRTLRPKVVSRAEVELILDAVPTKETEARSTPSF
jgi:hypothetical protein